MSDLPCADRADLRMLTGANRLAVALPGKEG
jgi:hypothetical protein